MVTATTTPPEVEPITPADVGSNRMPGANGRKFRIAGDVVNRSVSELPSEERRLIWWLYHHCVRHDFNKDELGKLLKKPNGNEFYSGDSIVQMLSGGRIRRGENIQPMLTAIKSLKDIEEERESLVKSGFIETRLYKEIERRVNRARVRQRIQFVFGESQIGKTESLLEYKRRHNHGQTLFMECPTGGRLDKFLQALGKELNITYFANIAQLSERIIDGFDSNMVLICDEMHRCLKRGSVAGLEVFSFLRELWNRKKCGIVVCMTDEGRDNFLHGPHSKALQQLWRRRMPPLQLPSVPPLDDLALFADAYGLEPAGDEPVTISVTVINDKGKPEKVTHTEKPIDLQTRVVKAEGLGVWISILQDASDMAKEQRKLITWGAVIKAVCQAQAEADIFV